MQRITNLKTNWEPINSSQIINTYDKYLVCDISVEDLMLILPDNPRIGQILGIWINKKNQLSKVFINSTKKINNYFALTAYVEVLFEQVLLVYINESVGWITSTNNLTIISNYSSLVLEDNPWAYYRFNEISGTTAIDSSINSRNGVYQNCLLNQPGSLSYEPSNKSIILNGSSSYVQIPFQVNNPKTITFEIKFKTFDTSGGFIVFGNNIAPTSSNYDKELSLNNGKLSFRIFPGGTLEVSSPTYNDDEWHIATVVYSSVGCEIYVDGEMKAISTINQSENINGYFRIGQSDFGQVGYLNGSIDEAAIWLEKLPKEKIINRHLSALF